jgi:hypothetical protein
MHDKQCTNGNIVFQPKLHLQQTLALLCPKPYKHPKTTKLNLNTTKEKDNGTLLCHHFLLRQRKEGHDVVFFFFFSNTKKIKHTRKQLKKNQKKGRSLPSSFCSAFSLLVLASAFPFLHFHFMCFLLASSSFQVVKKKNHKEKKNHRKEKTCKEGKELTFKFLLCPLTFDSRFCFPVLHFHFKCFILTFSFYQVEGEKKTTKKNKYAKRRRELTFKLLFCPFTFGSHFCLLTFALLFQALSLSIFFFSNKKKKTTQNKKPIEKKKNANKGRILLSSFRFALSFLAPTSALSFQVLSPNIFFFSNKRKKKTQ